MTKTYIENETVPHIPDEYSEDNLRKKFESRQNELWKEIEDNLEVYNQLKTAQHEAQTGARSAKYTSEEDLNESLEIIREQSNACRKQTDEIKNESRLLQKYGQAFANLYYIKEQQEFKGYDEKLSFVEVDITENGDVITDSQHYGMSFNPEGRLTQPALAVKTDDIEFNVGMMEFNKPNSAPEIKLQISIDEENVSALDAVKLNAIFDFCEKHGISSSDMVVRRFDGTIDDGAVQEKINQMVNEVMLMRAEQESKANAEEYAQQKSHEQELVKDIEKVAETNGFSIPKGMSLEDAVNAANENLPEDRKIRLEDLSLDIPPVDRIMGASSDNKSEVRNSFKNEHLRQLSSVRTSAEEVGINDDAVTQLQQNDGRQSETQSAQAAPATPAAPANSVAVPQQAAAPATNTVKKVTLDKAEKVFEKFFEEGLAKRKDYSYFKTHTGLFGTGWTEYIIYDTEDKKNRRRDGVEDKNGNVKYTYTFKLFIKEGPNGSMNFAYRTPYHKPLSDDIIGGIVGQLKDMGFTHVNFPSGVPDKEKGAWRKALAEKGLIPVGMGLDRSKAETMIKAAKEKLSSEALSNYKYKLALQMDKRNKEKGKKVDKSEQDFIDGLILAHKYEAFSGGYSEVLKGKITRLVHPPKENPDGNGAVSKIAAMANLRRLFNAFKQGVDAGSILDSEVLTDREKNLIRNNPELVGNPSKFTGEQLGDLYDILMEQSLIDAKNDLDKKFKEPGAKRADEAIKQGEFNAAYNSCKSIIKELKSLGVDEIDLPETTTKLPYNAPVRAKPAPTNTNAPTPPQRNNGRVATNSGRNY